MKFLFLKVYSFTVYFNIFLFSKILNVDTFLSFLNFFLIIIITVFSLFNEDLLAEITLLSTLKQAFFKLLRVLYYLRVKPDILSDIKKYSEPVTEESIYNI